MTANISVIILAAGQGTRMRSDLPKVLHKIGARSMLEHVVVTAQRLDPHQVCVVYGHGGAQVPETLKHLNVRWVEQMQRFGTGHAVAQAIPQVVDDDVVLVLYGDVPLINAATLRSLVDVARSKAVGLVTVELDDARNYGRIVRTNGKVARIVEEKDASPDERKIREVNTGLLAAPAHALRRWLAALRNDNAQGEYYLTDVIAMAVNEGLEVRAVHPARLFEVLGVNNKLQLAELEREYQRMLADELMTQGVTLRDPKRVDIRGELLVGKDVTIDVNAVFEGRVELGDRVIIGPNNVIRDAVIGSDTHVKPNCVIEDARIGASCEIGPYARIRPQTALADKVHIGNFVELKKSEVGHKSKINHLSYVGDTTVGSEVNIGAGTITCNYDGANKFRTVIGDHAFIGSDTQLIAPIEVGAGATIGAGTTLTKNAPPGELTLSRAKQTTVNGWKRPVKKKAE